MTKSTPITLISLFCGGILLISLKVSYTVLVGLFCLLAGLLLGLIGFFHAVVALAKRSSQLANGITIPIITILISAGSWLLVVYSINQVKKSFDKQHIWIKQQQWKKLHKKEIGISQPTNSPYSSPRETQGSKR